MTTLPFAETHNLVVFLDKPAESKGFEQIVDFLNASSIRYALTVNLTIYTSCIQQFWATVKVKTVNGEVQLQVLVDGKKIIITESTIRRDLQLEDAEAGDMSNHKRIYVTPSHTKKLNKNRVKVQQTIDPHHTPTIAQPSSSQPQKKHKPRKPKKKDTQIPQSNVPSDNLADDAINEENVSKHSNDPLLNDEDRMKLEELMTLEGLGEEDASKHGRKIHDIDADEDITLENVHDEDMFDTCVFNDEEVFSRQDITEKDVSTTDLKLKSARPKIKGVVMQEPSETTTTTTIPSKDKGKGIMVEEPLKMKKKD
ncbi:hypothetical protein Tco_1142184 [Tanacetum coccineum]